MRKAGTLFRILYTLLIIASFFIPAYAGVSAVKFFEIMIASAKADGEIELFDLLVRLVPLALIPLAAFFILVRTVLSIYSKRFLVGLPLLFLLSFLLISVITI